jgi:hypothetical protein
MNDSATYTFRIKDFTPQSMPFGRLLEYYEQIKKMLGVEANLYLLDIVESSHGSMFAIDREFEATLTERLHDIENGTAPKPALKAHDNINKMLKADGTSGSFSDIHGDNVILFPGRRSGKGTFLKVRDAATFVGELYHISGTKDDVRIRVNTDAFGVVFCTTTREIAKELRDFLFEDVKVSGRGSWTRDEGGVWNISDFRITDFTPVRTESLRQAVDRIRSLGINWPDDPLGEIRELNEKNGSVH